MHPAFLSHRAKDKERCRRSWSGRGRGIHDEDFSHYEYMPAETEQKVIAEAKRAKEMGNGAK